MAKRARQSAPLPSEYLTCCAIAEALSRSATPGWLYSHIPSGEERTGLAGARLQKMGLARGWPDYLLISPGGRLHALEVKKGRAALKAEQARFGRACQACGIPWAVARSFEEAVAKLSEWGALAGFRVSA